MISSDLGWASCGQDHYIVPLSSDFFECNPAWARLAKPGQTSLGTSVKKDVPFVYVKNVR